MNPPISSDLLSAQGISKRFGLVQALSQVNFTLREGEIHALLGENGAGKTTLMNIFYGLYPPDAGGIFLRGQPVHFSSPASAVRSGIGMVHQHFTLVPSLTVAENLSLGTERGRYRPQKVAQRLQTLASQLQMEMDPFVEVGTLSVGMQQRVEILKALYQGAQILILDEPTSVLGPLQVQELFHLLRRLKSQGTSIIFITHKLPEVFEIADRVTVLRRGQVVLTASLAEVTPPLLARAMVGEEIPSPRREPLEKGKVIFRVQKLSAPLEGQKRAFTNVSFEIREGEILGIIGVEGSGQSELAEVITGLRPAGSGTLFLYGQPLSFSSPSSFISRGGAHIPEDRQRTGLVLAFSVLENLILVSHAWPPFRRGIRLNWRVAEDYSRRLVREYDIRTPSIFTPASALSGGNQQKVVVAREFSRNPSLLVAVNPTRGLDIRATEYIRQKILEHRRRGGATLLISSDLEEVLQLSDRIGVMYEGRLLDIVPSETPREKLGLLMAGVEG